MADPAPMQVVRSRFPLAPAGDESELRDYAAYLASLRGRLHVEDLANVEVVVTFDARGAERDG